MEDCSEVMKEARLRGAPALVPLAPALRSRMPRPRVVWAWARLLVGAGILGYLLWQMGTGPFLDGVRRLDSWSLTAALAIGAVTTVCSAWRWSLIAGGLGVPVRLATATAHYYRSVFLNATLPGGVLGDAHRAVCHGRGAGSMLRAVRAVVWERAAGQVVLVVIALLLLAAFPSPVRPHLPVVLAVSAGGLLAAAVGLWALPRHGQSRPARALRAARADLRDGLLARANWPGIAGASAVAVAGHLAMFLVAARTAGATAPVATLLPLTLLALLAMVVPANVAGFGPREGVAAWAFGAAGLTAAQGVTTAIVYGALGFVASLPGIAVLAAWRFRGPAKLEAKRVPLLPLGAEAGRPLGTRGGGHD